MNSLIIVLLVILTLIISGICSGLNISIMAIDLSDLDRKSRLGNKNAKILLPYRRNIHLSVVSILIVNIASVSALSLILNTRLNGLLAGIVATFLTVIFAEILPQALFVKNPIIYTSYFSPFLKLLILLSYPVSKPLQLILDKILPVDYGSTQSRRELGLIISDHLMDKQSEIDQDEITIMIGALQLSNKTAKDIMTPLSKVYYLNSEDKLDGDKIDQIKEHNFSRIPVINKNLDASPGILIMKNLVDINFDDNKYLVSDMKLHPASYIGSNMALDTLFRKFISIHSHLLIIVKKKKIIGIVTIEDLLEEIIGHEIEDESDIIKRNLTD